MRKSIRKYKELKYCEKYLERIALVTYTALYDNVLYIDGYDDYRKILNCAKYNKFIENIYVTGVISDDKIYKYLSDVLKINKRIKSVTFNNVIFNDVCMLYLYNFLSINKSLEELVIVMGSQGHCCMSMNVITRFFNKFRRCDSRIIRFSFPYYKATFSKKYNLFFNKYLDSVCDGYNPMKKNYKWFIQNFKYDCMREVAYNNRSVKICKKILFIKN